ncbi:hypothetical protein D3C87_1357070 [compost metagenome]
MGNRSIWSGRYSDSLIKVSTGVQSQEKDLFVEPEYKEELSAYLVFADKWKHVFLGLVLSSSCVIAILALVAPVWTIGACLVLLAVFLIVLPLPTPQTIQLLGVRKSILLIRAIAVLVAGIGIWISFR